MPASSLPWWPRWRRSLLFLSAIFIAGIFVGADTMGRTLGVSNYIADLIVALALLCVLVSGLFLRFRIRFG